MFLTQTSPEEWVVPITCSDPRIFGTGFVIHQEENKTYLLTCRHVIDQIDEDTPFADYCPAYVVASDNASFGFDLAVLCVKKRLDKQVLPLSPNAVTGMQFTTAGYYQYGQQRLTESLVGKFGTKVLLSSDTLQKRISAWHLILEGEDRIRSGYSGAPVFDNANQVVGIASHEQREGKRGLAISIEALVHIWPSIPTHLRDAATGQRQTVLPTQSGPRYLMNFEKEVAAFERIAHGVDTETKLLTIHGESGTGKTRLLEEYELIAKQNELDILTLSLETQFDIEDCLEEILYYFGQKHFQNYSKFLKENRSNFQSEGESWSKDLTREFFNDLEQMQQIKRLVLLFDVYEKSDQHFRRWMESSFLRGLRQQPLIVIIAGQEKLEHTPNWEGQKHFRLRGVSVDRYRDYAEANGAKLSEKMLQTIHSVLNGEPKRFVEYVQSELVTKGMA